MKTAIVHEWFLDYWGSEKCVESFVNLYPDSEVYALFDFLSDKDRKQILKGKKTQTTFIQNLPFVKSIYKNFLPLYPLAVEQLDVSGADVVISSSHAFAKGVLTSAKQMHVCYCHTPVRYAWDLYHQYLKEAGVKGGPKGYFVRKTLHKIRIWDSTTANRVDHYIANSKHVAKRIKKIYGKEAAVIYPPVDINKCVLQTEKEDFYLAAARFVPYKRLDIIISAFAKTPDKKLLVIGDGPDAAKLKALAAPNIEFLPHQSYDKLIDYIGKAKAFIFGAEEDFGIMIVEALACGTPVIAYGVGGATETVRHLETGVLFEEQSPDSVMRAVDLFEENKNKFTPEKISETAQTFSRERFEREIKEFIEEKYSEFLKRD